MNRKKLGLAQAPIKKYSSRPEQEKNQNRKPSWEHKHDLVWHSTNDRYSGLLTIYQSCNLLHLMTLKRNSTKLRDLEHCKQCRGSMLLLYREINFFYSGKKRMWWACQTNREFLLYICFRLNSNGYLSFWTCML